MAKGDVSDMQDASVLRDFVLKWYIHGKAMHQGQHASACTK